jgi:hypothetical protein
MVHAPMPQALGGGSGDSNLDTNVDALKIKLKGQKMTTYNFEPNS